MFFNIFTKIKARESPSAFEKWRHRRAHASRRELQASRSRGGCHLLRRCRVHRPSRFAPAPATDPARYRSWFFRAEYAPLRFESRRVHSAAITRAASEARSFVLARATVQRYRSPLVDADLCKKLWWVPRKDWTLRQRGIRVRRTIRPRFDLTATVMFLAVRSLKLCDTWHAGAT